MEVPINRLHLQHDPDISPAVVLLLVTLDYHLTAAVVLVVGQQGQGAETFFESVSQFKSLYSVTKVWLLPASDPAALFVFECRKLFYVSNPSAVTMNVVM